MIGFLRGIIEGITDENVILDVNGVGYNILLNGKDFDLLPGYGEEVKLYTYLSVREDAMKLYGFLTREDLEFFKLLIGVNGIGPKVGQGILSGLGPDELRFAILANDAKTISKCPGVGAKTAQRIILDLKDKIEIEDVLSHGPVSSSKASNEKLSDIRTEAVEALTALGYSASDALRAVKMVENAEEMDTEMLLKNALKHISVF